MDEMDFRYVADVEEAAVRSVLEGWKHTHPGCAALALLPEAEASALPALQSAGRAAGVSLVGGVFPKLVDGARFVGEGAWLFRMDGAPPHGLVEDLTGDADAAAQRIAAAITPALDARPPGDTLFLFFDATTPNIASILAALYLELGTSVRYLGANAGSETFQPIPCLFDGERVSRGLLWMLVARDRRTLLLHDYSVSSGSSVATSSAGNRIASIDFRPAFEFYRDTIRAEHGIELDRSNFYRHAVEYPLGIQLANGQVVVRMPIGLEEDGTILCLGEVPEHAMLAVLRAPAPGSEETARMLATGLAERGLPRAMLLFYCAGRRLRLGAESERDLAALVAAAGATVGGAVSLGEIGSVDDGAYPIFHNGALVCAGWAAR